MQSGLLEFDEVVEGFGGRRALVGAILLGPEHHVPFGEGLPLLGREFPVILPESLEGYIHVIRFCTSPEGLGSQHSVGLLSL